MPRLLDWDDKAMFENSPYTSVKVVWSAGEYQTLDRLITLARREELELSSR